MTCPKLMIPALLLCAGAHAQWLNYREPGVPRLKDGKVNLSAPAPHTGGKPALTGVRMHDPTPTAELKHLFRGTPLQDEFEILPPGMDVELQTEYAADLLIDFGPNPPLRPEAVAFMQRCTHARPGDRPPPNCFAGISWPIPGLLSEPIKIVQAPKETIVLYEATEQHRQIFADGRRFPAEFELPAFLGYSVGRWEGDTFVVETRGFNDKEVFDQKMHPRSEAMHVTERFRRRDFGHLDYEMTFDDPMFYTRPWTVRIPHTLVPDNDIFEMSNENEKDIAHLRVLEEVNLSPSALAKYAGLYEFAEGPPAAAVALGRSLTLAVAGDRLTMNNLGLSAQSETTFGVTAIPGATLQFSSNASVR
jgi:hypothetical protein